MLRRGRRDGAGCRSAVAGVCGTRECIPCRGSTREHADQTLDPRIFRARVGARMHHSGTLLNDVRRYLPGDLVDAWPLAPGCPCAPYCWASSAPYGLPNPPAVSSANDTRRRPPPAVCNATRRTRPATRSAVCLSPYAYRRTPIAVRLSPCTPIGTRRTAPLAVRPSG